MGGDDDDCSTLQYPPSSFAVIMLEEDEDGIDATQVREVKRADIGRGAIDAFRHDDAEDDGRVGGTTSVEPRRDDFEVEIDGLDMRRPAPPI